MSKKFKMHGVFKKYIDSDFQRGDTIKVVKVPSDEYKEPLYSRDPYESLSNIFTAYLGREYKVISGEYEDMENLPGKELVIVDTSQFDVRGRILKVGPTVIFPVEVIEKIK
jgi:hypothetical protein